MIAPELRENFPHAGEIRSGEREQVTGNGVFITGHVKVDRNCQNNVDKFCQFLYFVRV
jgi:hypothetical protein